jgi:hypothetical protein
MKKLLVKIKVIDIPYSPAVEAIPQKWTKEVDGEIISFYEQPLKVVDAQMVNDESYTYHPDVAAIPEVLEVSHEEIIAQTQGSDDELAQWLAGDSFKYPQDHWVEYIDLEQDYDYLLAKCHALRIGEYPSLGDQADAAFKARQGDNSQQLAIDIMIEAVKAKYPKPEKL